MQAVTGGLLLVLLTVHMIANHFVVKEVGGLRTFAQVVQYVSHPLIIAVEALFLVVVTRHALSGVRAVLLDFGFSARVERRITRVLVAIGLLTVAYGGWLLWKIASFG